MASRENKQQNGPNWEAVLSFIEDDQYLVGIDEVGRGAWAGPVVAAAVILPAGLIIEGVNDSKLVTARRRHELDRQIRRLALAVGIGWVSCGEVDRYGLSWAVQQSGLRALDGLSHTYHHIILDGHYNFLRSTHQAAAIVKADQLVMPVAAASIVAKVARDRYMQQLGRLQPQYGFEAHKGYGTRAHSTALTLHGASSSHRFSYLPVREAKRVA